MLVEITAQGAGESELTIWMRISLMRNKVYTPYISFTGWTAKQDFTDFFFFLPVGQSLCLSLSLYTWAEIEIGNYWYKKAEVLIYFYMCHVPLVEGASMNTQLYICVSLCIWMNTVLTWQMTVGCATSSLKIKQSNRALLRHNLLD